MKKELLATERKRLTNGGVGGYSESKNEIRRENERLGDIEK